MKKGFLINSRTVPGSRIRVARSTCGNNEKKCVPFVVWYGGKNCRFLIV